MRPDNIVDALKIVILSRIFLSKYMFELSSKRLIYKTLTVDNVSQTYVDWLNDPEVNCYLETRHMHQTAESCRSYVADMEISSTNNLFGIYLRESGQHIGNVKLGFINPYYQRAQLSLFIGEKDCWEKGFATETIKAITSWGFNDLKLEKIEAGCYDKNIGSLRAFLKAGYQVEGYLRKNIILDDERIGSFWLGALPNDAT